MNKNMIGLVLMLFLLLGYTYASTVTRSFSSATFNPLILHPGDDLTVTLTVDVTGTETFYGIDETVPSGWVVKDAGGGNNVTAPYTMQMGHLKWVEIQEAIDTTRTYVLTAPNQTGVSTFAGEYMFEGMNNAAIIGGQTSVTVTNCVNMQELMYVIGQWKQGNITMVKLMQNIAKWKAGTGC